MTTGQPSQHLALGNIDSLDDVGATTETSSTAEGAKKGFNVGPIIRTLKRNIPLILLTTGLLGGLSFLLYKRAPSEYAGNFRLLVEPITSQARSADPSAISRDRVLETNGSSVDYPTLLQALQSYELLDTIQGTVEKIKQDPSKYFDPKKYPELAGVNFKDLKMNVTADSLLRALRTKDLVVQRIGTNLVDFTRTIDVSFKGDDPKKVLLILKALEVSYLEFSLKDRTNRIGGGVKFIDAQLPALQKRVDELETRLQELRQQYRLNEPNAEGAEVAKQFRETQAQRLESQRQLNEQVVLYNSLRSQLQLSPDQALSAASLSQNPRYQNLLNELKKVEQEIAVKKARYNEGSPVIEVLRDRERNLNSLLRQEAGEILGVAAGPEVLSFQDAVRIDLIRQMVTAANNVQMLQIRSQEIAQVEAQLDQRLQSIPAIVRRYSDLVQELDIATKTLNQFLLQRETLRVEAAQKEVPWEVIAQPRLFSDARGKPFSSKGKAQRTLLMGVAAGVFLGLLAALLRDRMSNKFYSFEDVRDGFAYPFLGTIPTSPMMGKPLNGHRIQSSKEFFDAFNTLYTNLRFLKPNNVVKSIVVTSIEPRDGKTTIASNLAQTTANMGQRVLLVDANLRNPSLHDYFNLSNRKGLADVLMGQVELDLAVQQSHTDNLTVLPAGQIEVDPARLMASANMQNFLKQAQAQFDVVILDASHLQEQADVHFLAPLTDGMLLVVGVQKTPRSSIKPVMDDVQKYRLPVIGVVANGSIVGKASTSSTPSETTSSGYQKSALFGNFKALQSNSFNAPNEFKPVSQSKSADESTDLLN